jgi:hypothetical protein
MKGATEMLYGAPRMMAILAADLRSGDRRAADQTRAPARAEASCRAAASSANASLAAGAPDARATAPWSLRILGRPSR